jgi:hypothetical protein
MVTEGYFPAYKGVLVPWVNFAGSNSNSSYIKLIIETDFITSYCRRCLHLRLLQLKTNKEIGFENQKYDLFKR